jgi:hypothetical protein
MSGFLVAQLGADVSDRGVKFGCQSLDSCGLLLLMVLVTRRWRTFLGFAAGAAALFLATTAFEGSGISPVSFHPILSFGKVASGLQASSIRTLI